MKIALLIWNSEPIMNSLARAFEKEGHTVAIVTIDSSCQPENVFSEVERIAPDFCFTHNFYVFDSWRDGGPQFEEYLRRKGIPVGTWYWDSPRISGYYALIKRLTDGPVFPSQILFFVVDRTHQEWLEQRGLTAIYLPIGVRELFFESPPREELKSKFKCDISFVGKPCEPVPGKTSDPGELWRQYIDVTFSHFCSLLSLSGATVGMEPDTVRDQKLRAGRIMIQFFSEPIYTAEQCDKRLLECLEVAQKILFESVFRDLELYMSRVEFFYSWFQLNQLLIDLLEFDLSVFGGEDWSQKLLSGYGYKKNSPFLTDDELHACFAFSPISFCHTKWPFRMGVHERPLMVLSAGGFPLADYRAGLDDLFARDEIAVYHDDEDLMDKVAYYLKNEDARLKMSQKGRARVLRDHTYVQRGSVIVREMRRHFCL